MITHNDEPSAKDELGRQIYVDALSSIAVQCETPLVIGVYGRWGYGKTTLLKLVYQNMIERNNVHAVWFDAWQHQFDDKPVISLIQTMCDQLGVKKSAKKIIYSIARGLVGWALKTNTPFTIGGVESTLTAYEKQNYLIREESVKLRQHFEDLINTIKNHGVNIERIVIFIDDLDRCLPNSVLNVLEALKLYLNMKGCVYFIGVDKGALDKSVQHQFRDYPVDEISYLDKIIQIPFIIPPIEPGYANKYIRECFVSLKNIFSDGDITNLANILLNNLSKNPRTIKRFINTLMLNYTMAQQTITEPKIEVLCYLLLIQYRKPETYNRIINNPDIGDYIFEGVPLSEFIPDIDHEIEHELEVLKERIKLQNISSREEFDKYIYLTRFARINDVTGGGSEFLTKRQLLKVLVDDAVIDDMSMPAKYILLFSTGTQQTWLIRFDDKLACLRDDDETRETDNVLQWVKDVKDINEDSIKAYRKAQRGVNAIVLGGKSPWLYSDHLYADPKVLEDAIKRFVTEPVN